MGTLVVSWLAAAAALQGGLPAQRRACPTLPLMLAGFGKKAPPPKPVRPAFKGKQTFEAHMQAYSKLAGQTSAENQVDVYVRSRSSNKVPHARKTTLSPHSYGASSLLWVQFWFVGKSLAADGVCDAACSVVLQKR